MRNKAKIASPLSGRAQINEIATYDGAHESAPPDAVALTLTSEPDFARADMPVTPPAPPEVSDQFAANVIWMGGKPLVRGVPISCASAPRLCRLP
jgi:bifunctional enzyme CysN/CysC